MGLRDWLRRKGEERDRQDEEDDRELTDEENKEVREGLDDWWGIKKGK